MVEHPGFLADILAHPADDVPRLIYADWLTDNGQEERAEFIRVQCELATLPDPKRIDFLRCREWELLEKYKGWFPRERLPIFNIKDRAISTGSRGDTGVGPSIFHFFRRGFVWRVECPLQAWLDHGRALVRAHPIETVRATNRVPGQPMHNWDPELVGWYGRGHPYDPEDLPPRVAVCLRGYVRYGNNPDRIGYGWYGYESAETAQDALSDALIVWART